MALPSTAAQRRASRLAKTTNLQQKLNEDTAKSTRAAANGAQVTAPGAAMGMPAPQPPPPSVNPSELLHPSPAFLRATHNGRTSTFVLADHIEDILDGVTFIPYSKTRIISLGSPLSATEAWDEAKLILAVSGQFDDAVLGEGVIVDANGVVTGTYEDTPYLISEKPTKKHRIRAALHTGYKSVGGLIIPKSKQVELGKAFDSKAAAKNGQSDIGEAMKLLGMGAGFQYSQHNVEATIDELKQARLAAHAAKIEAARARAAARLEATGDGTAANPVDIDNPATAKGPSQAPDPAHLGPQTQTTQDLQVEGRQLRTRKVAARPAANPLPYHPYARNTEKKRTEKPRANRKRDAPKLAEAEVQQKQPVVSEAAAEMGEDRDDSEGEIKDDASINAAEEKVSTKKKFPYIFLEPDLDAEGRPFLDNNGLHIAFKYELGQQADDRLVITRKHRVTGTINKSLLYPSKVDWEDQKCISKMNTWRAQNYRRGVEGYARYAPRVEFADEEKAFLRDYWRKEMKKRGDAGTKALWESVLVAFVKQFPKTTRKQPSISSWCSRDAEVTRIRQGETTGGGKKRKNEDAEADVEDVVAGPGARARKTRQTRPAKKQKIGGERVDEVEEEEL
ncbi:hypothetical protein BU16DRAFT_579339 [Lophium mytilinum]|uniref:Uncharacterized protein n=1 Tax=Lophium mytilinum TaxID=390894 RepID=A0A6A6R090_9PEZI|nr:hypothetical protein BU16DRAFT_579339 [Lophium mytilinum]